MIKLTKKAVGLKLDIHFEKLPFLSVGRMSDTCNYASYVKLGFITSHLLCPAIAPLASQRKVELYWRKIKDLKICNMGSRYIKRSFFFFSFFV